MAVWFIGVNNYRGEIGVQIAFLVVNGIRDGDRHCQNVTLPDVRDGLARELYSCARMFYDDAINPLTAGAVGFNLSWTPDAIVN